MTAEPAIHRLRGASFRFDPRPWPWAEAHAERIDAHWAKVAAGNPSVFDGHVLMLHEGALDGDRFEGAYLETRYSRFLAWRDFGFPEAGIRNCFGMGALQSGDGAFLLGIMGDHTSNAGKMYFPAGTPDREDIVGGSVDLIGSIARELVEETGLALGDLVFTDEFSLIEHGARLALLQRVRAEGSAQAVTARIRANLAMQDEPELADMAIIRTPEDVAANAAAIPPFLAAWLRRELALQPAG